MKTVSIRAFAKLDGCSEGLVRRAIREGKLVAAEDGRLDPMLAKSSWRRTNAVANHDAKIARTPVRVPEGDDSLEQLAAKRVARATVIPAIGESLARKAHYEAELKELEHDLKVGAVVLVEDSIRCFGEMVAAVRVKILAIPSNCAPRIARLKTAPEVHAAITDAIHEALAELVANPPQRGESGGP